MPSLLSYLFTPSMANSDVEGKGFKAEGRVTFTSLENYLLTFSSIHFTIGTKSILPRLIWSS